MTHHQQLKEPHHQQEPQQISEDQIKAQQFLQQHHHLQQPEQAAQRM
jgi:hypothetical protein